MRMFPGRRRRKYCGLRIVKYELIIKRKALKELARIPKVFRDKIEFKIDKLAEDPLIDDVKKLIGEESMYRFRHGDYRVIFTIDFAKKKVVVLKVFSRSAGY